MMGIESITTRVLGVALDAASLRQQVIAANIANASTVGYVPQRVSFEEQLDDAHRVLQSQGSLDEASVASLKMQLIPMMGIDGMPEKVQLDMQTADLAQNNVQYQALIKGLNKHFSILETAFNDGKR